MASKFPSLEEIDEDVAQTSTIDADGDDFLTREKAALGEAASEFQTSEDAAVGEGNTDDIAGFKASFPALEESNNDVCVNFGRSKFKL